MSVPLTQLLLNAIQDTQLLTPAQWDELTTWVQKTDPQPIDVVKEIRRNGWLTDFQIKELSRGRGKQLKLGPYVLYELLGEGGMGRVFKARHTRLGRDVALKVIRKEKLSKPSVIQRFHQEIRAAAQLSHPNVVMAFDADEVNGTHYFAMEYVEGTDLSKVVRDTGPIPYPQACDYIRQTAIGLQHAHERGLVHRDVKPSNLLLTSKGQIKLLDLGLVMLNNDPNQTNGDDANNRVTHAGLVLGTPDFLAPEQAQDPLGVDIRADVYAMGATLFFLLTGKVPFPGPTATDKLIQHVTEPPPSLLEYLPDAPPHLDAVIKWLMAKRPQDRPQNPNAVAYALLPFCPPGTKVGTSALSSEKIPMPTAFPLPTDSQANAPTITLPTTAPRTTSAVATVAMPQSNLNTYPQQQFPFPQPSITASPFEQFVVDLPVTSPQHRRVRRPKNRFPKKALIISSLLFLFFGGFIAIGSVIYQQFHDNEPPLPDKFANPYGITMIRLPGGTFIMGSTPDDAGHEANEGPAGDVTVNGPIFMSMTEITHSQFLQVMGRAPSRWAIKLRKAKDAPVDSVTWDEANEFCKKLSLLDRKRRDGWGYRLPTEAEWEYACRAGSNESFASGKRLVYGKSGIFNIDKEDEDKPLGEEDATKPRQERGLPYPVASTTPNAFGLYDMHGNVWEWCHDIYAPTYADRVAQDPTGPAEGEQRVLRGGSWRESSTKCRSAARRAAAPDFRGDDVGFRVVYAPN